MLTYRVLKHVTPQRLERMNTSVAETEDEKVEKIKPPREIAEEVKMEETRTKKLVEEQLPQEETLRAEELEPEGNRMSNNFHQLN